MGGMTVESWSSTQRSIATPSGDSDFHAVVRQRRQGYKQCWKTWV